MPHDPLAGRDGLQQRRDAPVTRSLNQLARRHRLTGAVLITFDTERVGATCTAESDVFVRAMQRLADRLLADIDDGKHDWATTDG